MTTKHWSKVELLHQTVNNPNIHITGTHSNYSNAWRGNFEESVVHYLYGDEYSLANREPRWEIDQLFIGDYVCIAAEIVERLVRLKITNRYFLESINFICS